MTDNEPASGSEPLASQSPEPSKLAEAGISDETIERGLSLEGLDPHDHEALKGLDHWQDIRLKKSYAVALLCLVSLQLFVADAVFVTYAWAGEHWHLDPGVIKFWLGATLIELIGVALVITQYLFPRRDLR
jgi:hypothetical protein